MEPKSNSRPPRWVLVSGVIAILLVAAFVALHLAGLGMAGMH